ncbi:FGGY-family carbohydrate kinase [Lacipirellula parvula]|uniref:Carbohydrate kinase n=1 Tax=Lacipirellula parvula TaxID=2650471 RepID=A0A5K7XAC2_9BACT|nr:FGGY-family carbohydrate kinase [Lacipirellula parvula]BBO31256.1 hypothetical protein PLANPX_0868 [Lacipirellula parvula]
MILAIDLGTTYFKFTLFSRRGELLRTVRVTPSARSPHAGWVEIPAEKFEAAICKGIEQVLAPNGTRRATVDAMVFATQGNSFTLLDAENRPLTPIILWSDRRAADIGAELAPSAGLADFSATTGIPALNEEFMVAKLQWLAREQPHAWKQTARICLISDYLTLLMTGHHVTEAGVAGLTGLVDIEQRDWWQPALERFGLNAEWLPQVVNAGTDLGNILPEMAQRLGIDNACRFIVGTLDQYAGAIGVGSVEPGMLSETTGTVLAAVACAAELDDNPAPGVYQGPAYRNGLYWRMSFGSVSANYLHWYRDQLPDLPEFDDLAPLATSVAPGADGLTIDRSSATPADALAPYVDVQPRGKVVRAIMETVAAALREHLQRLQGSSAAHWREVRSAGGGSRSAIWLQIKADVLNLVVSTTAYGEPTSLGAAILAEATLSNSPVAEVTQKWVRLQHPLLPIANNVVQYAAMANDANAALTP